MAPRGVCRAVDRRWGGRRGRRVAHAKLALAALCAASVLGACTAEPVPQLSPTPPGGNRPGGTVAEGMDVTGCSITPAYPEPDPDRPRYELTVTIPESGRTIEGEQAVTFTPDLATDRLVFRLWPNSPISSKNGARLEVSGLEGPGGEPLATTQPDPTTLEVTLAAPLEAGDPIEVSLEWELTVPGPVLDRLARDGDTVRLGSFFPILGWEPGVGWATDPPLSILGESSTSPTADFRVEVLAPRDLTVLASGRSTTEDTWEATAVRDFAIAVGRFEVTEADVFLPDRVQVRIGIDEDVNLDGEELMRRVGFTLGRLRFLYGPYPWDSFTLAFTEDIDRSGIEYPTLVFQGENSVDRVTAHELGHQWFYSLVGNNQARDPWLDEALATWSGAQVDGYLQFLLDTEVEGVAEDNVAAPMTFWDRFPDEYQLGVYVRGVQALAELGPPTRVDCAIRQYVAANAYGIATPQDFLGELRRQFPEAEEVLEPFGIPAPVAG